MTSPQNFRTAFHGFNRDDVVHYIEYLNKKHADEVNQLRSEADALRARLDGGEMSSSFRIRLTAAEDARDDYMNQLIEKITQIDELKQRCAALEAERDAAGSNAIPVIPVPDNRYADLQQQLDAALAAQAQAEAARDAALLSAGKSNVEQELEAYRRAERTERVARERAEQVYRQANGALADATAKVDEATSQISQVTDKVSAQLEQLQMAVASSKQALADAAATLYTIRPGSTED